MDGVSEELEPVSPRQNLLIERLLMGQTLRAVSEELGVHRSTCWRWLRDEAVQRVLRKRRMERWTAAREEMSAAALESTRFLRGVVTNESVSVSSRIRAACAVLDRAGLVKTATWLDVGIEDWGRSERERELLGGWL